MKSAGMAYHKETQKHKGKQEEYDTATAVGVLQRAAKEDGTIDVVVSVLHSTNITRALTRKHAVTSNDSLLPPADKSHSTLQ